jgi:hypothetical protein
MRDAHYLIWSEEHQAWWLSNRHGYTTSIFEAGRFSQPEVSEILERANAHLDPSLEPPINEVALAIMAWAIPKKL